MFLIYIYLILLIIYLFDINFFFFNEEFLIAICMLILFLFLLKSLRKSINFYLYSRIEYIYYYFLCLIKLNRNLTNKIHSLLSILFYNLDIFIIKYLLFFFNEILYVLNIKFRNINLNLYNNLILYFFSNNYFYDLFFFNKDLKIKYFVKNSKIFIDLLDNNSYLVKQNKSKLFTKAITSYSFNFYFLNITVSSLKNKNLNFLIKYSSLTF